MYISLVISLFDVEITPPTNVQEVLDSLVLITPRLKDLFSSNEESKLLRSSAILILIEQIIVAAKLIYFITHDQAVGLCKALKFNTNCENGAYLFLLKEQLHTTLAQIEYIADATLKSDVNENPFFDLK